MSEIQERDERIANWHAAIQYRFDMTDIPMPAVVRGSDGKLYQPEFILTWEAVSEPDEDSLFTEEDIVTEDPQ
jgi:hypothetical protein